MADESKSEQWWVDKIESSSSLPPDKKHCFLEQVEQAALDAALTSDVAMGMLPVGTLMHASALMFR